MRKINSRIVIDTTAPLANVDAIKEKVAFIKITVLFPQCFDTNGNVDLQKVKEVVRGIWRIRNEQVRNRIEYLIAIYRGHIVGVFRVIWVSQELSQAYVQGLPDFPSYPVDVRECDRWKARFATPAQARQVLSPLEYNRFIASITRGNTAIQHVLDLYRKTTQIRWWVIAAGRDCPPYSPTKSTSGTRTASLSCGWCMRKGAS